MMQACLPSNKYNSFCIDCFFMAGSEDEFIHGLLIVLKNSVENCVGPLNDQRTNVVHVFHSS